MAVTMYVREPGTAKPYGGQVRAVWAWLQLLRRDGRDPHMVGGGIAAAEWCIGLTNALPITGRAYRDPYYLQEAAMSLPDRYSDRLRPATNELIRREMDAADEAESLATSPADYDYAHGVHGFLAWWAGEAELPAEFVPDAHGRLPKPRQGAA